MKRTSLKKRMVGADLEATNNIREDPESGKEMS
jgi:hypothetical protein